MKSKVSIVKCESYDQARVDEAVHRSLELISGIGSTVKPGNMVLVKVNALMKSPPEEAITTHPAVVASVVKEVTRAGARAYVFDSPGDPSENVHHTMEITGIKKAAEEAGGKILFLEEKGVTEVPSPSHNQKIPSLNIFRAVLDADVVINLPKLKTHNVTLLTGAIKNMFGTVPGFNKSRYHILATRPHHFAQSLVDILEITRPRLNIMDAVVGMEGRGPTAGEKRLMGAILASTDAVALDAVASAAINYKPFRIETTRLAHNRGLGKGKLEEIEILGAPLEEITVKDWKHTSNVYYLTRLIPDFIFDLIRPVANQLRIDPVIIQEKCTKCLTCVKNCPAKTIHFRNNVVKIDLSQCIMCYCCMELCQYKAIKLRRSWLAKLLRIGSHE